MRVVDLVAPTNAATEYVLGGRVRFCTQALPRLGDKSQRR